MKQISNSSWNWIPSLYFVEAIPLVVVSSVSVILYKRLGLANAQIALYTSWLYLPWVIKAFWSPIVELIYTRRYWIILTQLLMGAALSAIAFTLPLSDFWQYSLAFFWLIALSSATHDIAADGFYMLALPQGEQAFFVGIRSTFYRLAMVTAQGLLVVLAGELETYFGLPTRELTVRATANTEAMHYPSLIREHDTMEGDLGIVLYYKELNIALADTTAHFADSLLNFVKENNLANQFYEKNTPAPENSLQKHLDRFFESYLPQKKVQVEEKKSIVPSVGITYLSLSAKPKGKIVVEISAENEDEIRLLEGRQLVFNENNWGKSAFLLFQNAPDLDTPTKVIFKIKANNVVPAWQICFIGLAFLLLLAALHHYKRLPYPSGDQEQNLRKAFLHDFLESFWAFFQKEKIIWIISFLLFYRLGEAQLVKIAAPFLMDKIQEGGLGLSTSQIGMSYGTVGMIALTLGGIVGGIVVAQKGLRYWLLPMLLAINLPNVLYVFLAFSQENNFLLVMTVVAVEQLGYGFGFTAYTVYLLNIAQGKYPTAHYAFGTGFMALGMMLPGMFSGYIQQILGYPHFFIWVVICTIPSFILAYLIPLEKDFGKKS